MTSDLSLWTVEHVRSLPPEQRPTGDSGLFVGGMLDGQMMQIPSPLEDGVIPFDGYQAGRPVRQEYRLAGWRPDPGIWVYTLDKLP
jgi:hypothetical protein